MMTDDTDDDGNIGGSSEPVTEDELRYGLRMAQAGNFGSLSNPEARPSNSYERRIMSELVHPEDVGAGFSEVGALTSVKDALPPVPSGYHRGTTTPLLLLLLPFIRLPAP